MPESREPAAHDRVLVVGASGALGASVVSALGATRRWDVVRGGRRPDPATSTRPAVTVDLADEASVRAAIRLVRPRAVVIAAGVEPELCGADPELARLVHATSLGWVLEEGQSCGVERVVVPSSSAVYGDAYDVPAREDHPLDPRTLYAETKVAAEAVVSAWNSSHSPLRATALRIFNVYGDGFSRSLVQRLLHSRAAEPVGLAGLDGFRRDYVSSRDTADAVLRVLESPGDLPDVINIGSGTAVSNRELVASLSRRVVIAWRETAARSSYSCADISLARRVLGFAPASILA
ncbi:NAD-dependent epimerase/dehydratase family protein [Frondihabitans australicus]|uniref:UDP-glucose 4-epimerase n=1 Tax=Frondihabitans australicus TaxID=386892 RepID=A0A495IJK4_9MICO|nr:NAD(P)-dependent oxidoreductase [Frondihabitans australicus]RKR76143.1 UDP-glucose 4-epimerase [Frondihabitans australicus]